MKSSKTSQGGIICKAINRKILVKKTQDTYQKTEGTSQRWKSQPSCKWKALAFHKGKIPL
jgi:hypothetical protein